jgi:hypothetical protein
MCRVQHARDIAGWHAFTLVSGFPRDDASLAIIAHWHISKARLYLYIPPFECMCHCLLICERQHGVFARSLRMTRKTISSHGICATTCNMFECWRRMGQRLFVSDILCRPTFLNVSVMKFYLVLLRLSTTQTIQFKKFCDSLHFGWNKLSKTIDDLTCR